MSEIQTAAIILAAGKGTRMKSDLPKVLHPLAGRPMIEYALDTVAALGVARTVVVVGAGMEAVAQVVKEAVAAGPAEVETVIQEPALGTGHAVLAAKDALASFSGEALVLYADTPLVTPATLATLLAARREAGAALAVLGFRAHDPAGYGRLVAGPGGALRAIVEDIDATDEEKLITLCNSGILAADKQTLFELLGELGNDNAKAEYYLTDVVARAVGRDLACTLVEGDETEVLGVNSRAQLAEAEFVLQDRLREAAMDGGATLSDPSTVYLSFDTRLGRDVTVEPNVFFGPGVTVGDHAVIRAYSHLEGVSVADGASVGPFARLRPGSRVGEGARIGNFVEIKKADIEAGAKVNHLAYVGDARVGEGANVGAGTITCNYDGFGKWHTDIGKGAFIGSNAALVAPVKIGDGASVGAGTVVVSDVAADDLVVGRPTLKKIKGGARRSRERKGKKEGG